MRVPDILAICPDISLRSRNENDFSIRYAGVTQALAALPDETVIDGEIVALDEHGKPFFNVLQTRQCPRTRSLLRLRRDDARRQRRNGRAHQCTAFFATLGIVGEPCLTLNRSERRVPLLCLAMN